MYHKELYYVNVIYYTYSDEKYHLVIVWYLLRNFNQLQKIKMKFKKKMVELCQSICQATEENVRDREK